MVGYLPRAPLLQEPSRLHQATLRSSLTGAAVACCVVCNVCSHRALNRMRTLPLMPTACVGWCTARRCRYIAVCRRRRPCLTAIACASRVLAECKIDFAEYAHPSSGGGGAGPNTAATATTFRLGAEVRPNRVPEGTRAASRAHSRTNTPVGLGCAGAVLAKLTAVASARAARAELRRMIGSGV